MLSYSSITKLRANMLTVPELVAQVDGWLYMREESIQAFVPEEDRSNRLYDYAELLTLSYPDLIKRPLLFGALVGVKDIFHVDGFVTQAGSRLPSAVLQGKQAESVTRLQMAGALIVGKTVTTEFAYFSPGPTRNPHNLEHTPGGSSSGSAAAVAAGFCHLALGTQTIGSIIRPASFCGVVGLKPTYERISREGVIPLSPSLDHVGLLASDAEIALNAARALYKDWDEPLSKPDRPILGIPDGPYLKSAPHEALAWFETICNFLSKAGYEIRHVPVMDDFAEIRARNDVILSTEAAQVHKEWFAQYENLYSQKLADLIRRGQKITDNQLQDSLAAREQFRVSLIQTMNQNKIDLWICPSTLGAAPKGLESTGDPIMNLPWTQAGLPAMNLRAGKNPEGLPLGLQLVGNWGKDEALLFWAQDLEEHLLTL